MTARRDGGIGLGAALLLTGGLVVATLAFAGVAALVGMAARGTDLAAALDAVRQDPLLASLAQLGGAGVAIAVGARLAHGDAPLRDALSVRPVPTAVAILALTAGLGLAFPLRELALLLIELVPALAPDPSDALALARRLRIDSVGDALAIPLGVVAIPAAAEELFFRGLLLPGLARRVDPRLAAGASALLFGLIHVSPLAIAYATLAGLVLGWVRLRTGSVVPCVALHGAFNAVPILLPPELVRVRGFNTIDADVYHLPLALVLGSSLVTLACLVVIARLAEDEDE
jgi:membrane protease YdiL (CAAX protease family)